MITRQAQTADKIRILELLDSFRSDCKEQMTGKYEESRTARDGGTKVFESLLKRSDYRIFVLVDSHNIIVGVITGYLCPMMRNGMVRAEVEEFYVMKEYRGGNNARMLMDAIVKWAKSNNAQKVNLESEHELLRAHGFYEKYGFKSEAKRFVMRLQN